MAEIIRTRKISFGKRPSKSPSFKVDVNRVKDDDTVKVEVELISNGTKKIYYFHGKHLSKLDSIHCYLNPGEPLTKIKWSGAQPFKVEESVQRQPILFLRTAWMKNYKGVSEEDIPSGAGSYVTENLDGGEVYNFLPIKGNYYGFARIQSGRNLKLERLGAPKDASEIKNVTVVLFAKNPDWGGEFIVGFYKNAILHRNTVSLPKGTRGTHSFYMFKTAIANAQLIKEESRVFELPKDGPGQTNAWYVEEYADKNFLNEVLKYLANPDEYAKQRKGKKRNHPAWQSDAEKRKAVELAAMNLTADYFSNSGWDVEDVSSKNWGWDMQASKGNAQLHLEVKGLSGDNLTVELTPNEYAKCKNNSIYRICIVNNALDSKRRILRIFYFKQGRWVTSSGLILAIQEKVGAILSLK
ncbi:MAG: DUF3883 domain-containing protein [Bacteroidia bacterium]|nr:DUF3883 domain-containing protein [Bacteroidia bacterium]